MPEIKLYGTRLSPYVEKVVRALHLKGLAYELVEVKRPGDLRKWNPVTAKMPALEIDGEHVYDSTFILRRLEELQPEPALFSADATTAARERLLEDWADESLYWLRMSILWSDPKAAASAVLGAMPIPGLLKPVVGAVMTRQFLATIRSQGTGRLPREVLLRELALRLGDLAQLLGEGPYLFGERPGAADLAVFGQLHFQVVAPPPEFDKALDEHPGLRAWKERVDRVTAE